MGKLIKRIALGLLALVVLVAAGGGIYVYTQTSGYDASMQKVYDIKPLTLVHVSDAASIERGKHLSGSLAGCSTNSCHGADLGGGVLTEMGPVGTLAPPNITQTLPAYSDGELARLIRHGVKKDGRTVCFMPVEDFNWLPDSDIVALLSYLRTVPPVTRANVGTTAMKTLGKVLDRKNLLPADVARKIDHDHIVIGPPPSPTVEYGAFISHMCLGCHGPHLSGGPIPGAPKNLAVPLNLTADETGLKGFTFEDFDREIQTSTRKNGKKLDAMMPMEALREMNDIEKHALFAYLQSIPVMPFGSR